MPSAGISAHRGRHQWIVVDIPRARLLPIFHGNIPDAQILASALNGSALVALLGAHLAAFPACAAAMDAHEQLGLLSTSESFVITAIESAFAPNHGSNNGDRHNGLYAAAQRHIRLNFGNPGLSADEIAVAVGCSRATLYRVFAEHDLTVADVIRELRLCKLRSLLQCHEAKTATISTLALRCGLHDLPNVNRAFKKRFGLTPSDVRKMV